MTKLKPLGQQTYRAFVYKTELAHCLKAMSVRVADNLSEQVIFIFQHHSNRSDVSNCATPHKPEGFILTEAKTLETPEDMTHIPGMFTNNMFSISF
jgi:hypothetical protein